MKKIAQLALPIFSTLFTLVTQAQTRSISISGKVISFEESLALEGVAVTVKGTNKNSGTQADGTFSISVMPEDTVLQFSLNGYQTFELTLTGSNDYEVILKREGSADATGITLLYDPANIKTYHSYRLGRRKQQLALHR